MRLYSREPTMRMHFSPQQSLHIASMHVACNCANSWCQEKVGRTTMAHDAPSPHTWDDRVRVSRVRTDALHVRVYLHQIRSQVPNKLVVRKSTLKSA